MRPIAVVLIVVALVASGLAAWLVKHWMAASTVHQETGPVTAEVLVAGREISAGAVLQSGDLRWDKWPQSAVSPRLVTRVAGSDPSTTFVGKITRFALAEGEPITEGGVFKQDSAGVLAGMLAPGMRAVSVAITNPSAVSGFITPGDRVDVLLAADIARDSGKQLDSGPIAQYATETILENLRVLAIDQQIARGRDGAAMLGKTATLEVTPKQGEKLVTATMMGQLSLVLRSIGQLPPSPTDKPAPPADPFTADTEVSRALEAVHAGAFNAAPAAPAAPTSKAARPPSPQVRVNRGGVLSTTGY